MTDQISFSAANLRKPKLGTVSFSPSLLPKSDTAKARKRKADVIKITLVRKAKADVITITVPRKAEERYRIA